MYFSPKQNIYMSFIMFEFHFRQMISIHYSPFATQYGQNIIKWRQVRGMPQGTFTPFLLSRQAHQAGQQQPHLVKVFGQQWCKLGSTPPLDKSCHANRCEWPKTRQICTLGIQIRKSKIDLNMEALSIKCRNKH